jgi:hypothetical protein
VKETNLDKHPDFRNGVGIFHPFPELYTSFIDAFEVTSEVLISPVEVCPNLLSAYQVQELYFAKSQRMKSITGPWVSERDRIGQLNVPIAKSVLSFSERILLASPPLIFQQRRDDRACNISAMQLFLEQQLNLVRASHCRVDGECPDTESRNDIYTCDSDTPVTGTHFGLNTTTLRGQTGFADFLFTMADNEVIVRDQQLIPAREFLDMQTKSAMVVCLFYSPSNGDTTVLTLIIDVDGSRITTKVSPDYVGLLGSAQLSEVAAYYGCIFAICVVVLFLNLHNFLESREFVKKYGLHTNFRAMPDRLESVREQLESTADTVVTATSIPRPRMAHRELREAVRTQHETRTDVLNIQSASEKSYRRDIYFDVFLVLLVIAFCTESYIVANLSQSRAETFANIVSNVPWANPNVPVTVKITSFFGAIDLLESNLLLERYLFWAGFSILALLMYRITMATAIHPRLGILINTIGKGADGLSHFAILFSLVFLLFAFISTWSFAAHYDAFKDLKASMATQFRLFIFDVPEVVIEAFQHPDENIALVIFCVVTIILQSFLMFNFLVMLTSTPSLPVRCFLCDARSSHHFSSILVPSDTDLLLQIAIVLDAFIEAQAEHKACDIELSIFEDVAITLQSAIRELCKGLPTKRKFSYMLMNEVATNNVAWWQMLEFGLTPRQARSLFEAYFGPIDVNSDMPLERGGW